MNDNSDPHPPFLESFIIEREVKEVEKSGNRTRQPNTSVERLIFPLNEA